MRITRCDTRYKWSMHACLELGIDRYIIMHAATGSLKTTFEIW